LSISEYKNEFTTVDLRARNPNKANIFYIDQQIPNKSLGSGFGRSVDNLKMLAELGHKVTVVSAYPTTDDRCDNDCRNKIIRLGIEVVTSSWESFFKSRISYYNIIIVSRPSTFNAIHVQLLNLFKKASFGLIYDCEALWYQRDALMLCVMEEKRIEFPGASELRDAESRNPQNEKINEQTSLKMADVVI